jgi:cytochrome oxidase Cu insertion factor (SCO1/SenC/PrrC family)
VSAPGKRVSARAFAAAVLVAAAVLAAATGLAACGSSRGGTSRDAALAQAELGTPAPSFSLVDQFGSNVRLSDLRGSVVLLTFIDARCTTLCPLTADLLRRTSDELGGDPPVRLVAIDANPDANSVADVRRWSVQHRMLHDWVFLTAPLPRLARVWSAYGIQVVPQKGEVVHSAVIFVIDGEGRQRGVFPIATGSGMSAEVDGLAEAVRRVA